MTAEDFSKINFGNIFRTYLIPLIPIILGSGGIYGIIANKRNRRAKANESTVTKRLEAIEEIVRVERKASMWENIEITHPEMFNSEYPKFSIDAPIYPAILESRDSLHGFFEELSNVRKKYEFWISNKAASYLFQAEQYILSLLSFSNTFLGGEEKMALGDDLYPLGLIIAGDIQRWQRKFDHVLADEINKVPLKNTPHTGEKWERQKQLRKRECNDSALQKLIEKDNVIYPIFIQLLLCYLTDGGASVPSR